MHCVHISTLARINVRVCVCHWPIHIIYVCAHIFSKHDLAPSKKLNDKWQVCKAPTYDTRRQLYGFQNVTRHEKEDLRCFLWANLGAVGLWQWWWVSRTLTEGGIHWTLAMADKHMGGVGTGVCLKKLLNCSLQFHWSVRRDRPTKTWPIDSLIYRLFSCRELREGEGTRI